MKRIILLATSTMLVAGCQAPLLTEINEETLYTVKANSQVQFVASDIASKLGVAGVEWNDALQPWDYSTLRTRDINLSNQKIQDVYIDLFKDTGLLPYYDYLENRVLIQPYSVDVKQTTKFEPSFRLASENANFLADKKEVNLLVSKDLTRFNLYKGYSLRQTINSWAKETKFNDVIWYLSEPAQINIVTKKINSDMQIVERDALSAIKSILSTSNANNPSSKINIKVDDEHGILIFHDFSESEPLRAYNVAKGDTKSTLTNLASFYKLRLDYKAKNYEINTSYKTIITNNAEISASRIVAQYPLDIRHDESASRLLVTDQKID